MKNIKPNLKNCRLLVGLPLLFLMFGACSQEKREKTPPETQAKPDLYFNSASFGKLPSGQEAMLYTLGNQQGMQVAITNYGGIIVSLKMPDGKGQVADIVLGYDTLQGYLDSSPYFGAVVGRYANRIANGKFTLNGQEYQLAQNNNGQHLHGGEKGFDKVLWQAEPFQQDSVVGLKLTYNSLHMEEGYPGNLAVAVTYLLDNQNRLRVDYAATTDRPTIANLTQHSYFNLAGASGNPVLQHEMLINADYFIPVDSLLIPTGEIRGVEGTPLDFTFSKPVGQDIQTRYFQLMRAGGYDHCMVLDLQDTDSLKHAATVTDPGSGRTMELYTTEPGLQFYSGNFLDGSLTGKDGAVYNKHAGFCLEPGAFPDSPNRPEFPAVVLQPGKTWHSTTIYRLYNKKAS